MYTDQVAHPDLKVATILCLVLGSRPWKASLMGKYEFYTYQIQDFAFKEEEIASWNLVDHTGFVLELTLIILVKYS